MADALTDLIVSEQPERLASGFAFTEGPLWHPEGHWLFVDIPRERVQRLLADGTVETVREESGGANGLTFDLQRRLIMCEGGRIFADPPGDEYRRVTRMDADGSIAVLAERYEGARLNRPNDVVCHSDGSLYFTNPNLRLEPAERELDFAGVMRLSVAGELSVTATEMEYPNGLAFSVDERTMYVANTRPEPYLAAYDVAADGSLTSRRIFAAMVGEGEGVPDGLKVDVDDRIYCTGAGGCWVFMPDGAHLGTIPLPEAAANLGWGGADYRTLLFTARTSLYALQMEVAGVTPPGAR